MRDVVIGTLLMSAAILWITYIFRRSLTFEPMGANKALKIILKAAEKDRRRMAKRKEQL